MSQIYAVNNLSGIVVDISEEVTDITPIYDGSILHPTRTSVALGTRHCDNYLANLLKSNQGLINTLSPPETPLDQETLHSTLMELVRQMVKEGHIKVPSDGETAAPEDEGVTDIAAVVVAGREKAVIESGMKKKATAKASAAEQARAREIEALDLINLQFRGYSVTVGKERHRFCEPLFDPHLLLGLYGTAPADPTAERPLPIQDVVGHAISQTDVDQRQYLWQGLLVTGDITRHVKGRLCRCSPFFPPVYSENFRHWRSSPVKSRSLHYQSGCNHGCTTSFNEESSRPRFLRGIQRNW